MIDKVLLFRKAEINDHLYSTKSPRSIASIVVSVTLHNAQCAETRVTLETFKNVGEYSLFSRRSNVGAVHTKIENSVVLIQHEARERRRRRIQIPSIIWRNDLHYCLVKVF